MKCDDCDKEATHSVRDRLEVPSGNSELRGSNKTSSFPQTAFSLCKQTSHQRQPTTSKKPCWEGLFSPELS